MAQASPPSSALQPVQRTMKPPPLARNLPSQGLIEKTRMVSLPEIDGICAAKAELRANAMRIVSMPEQRHLRDTSISTDSQNVSLCSSGESCVTGDGDQSGSSFFVYWIYLYWLFNFYPVVFSDSILILECNGELSEAFLRPRPIKEALEPNSPEFKANENGMKYLSLPPAYLSLTAIAGWMSSPPRPIPALHGPLSLPYARCPSCVLIPSQRN